MTVTVTDIEAGPYTPNGATVAFPFDFKIASTAEIAVVQILAGVTTIIDPADYTVTIAVDGEGGTVTFGTAPLTGSGLITLLSDPDFTQQANFGSDGRFGPESLNALFDRSVIRDLRLRYEGEVLADTLTASVAEQIAAIELLPGPQGDPGPTGGHGTNGGAGSGSGFSALFGAANGMTIVDKRIKMDGYSLPGIGGADYIYDAAVTAGTVATNPRTQFLAADGRGFKLDLTQPVTIEMYGVVAGGTMAANGANNYAGILAAIALKSNSDRNYAPPIHWQHATYYCSQTINNHSVAHWIGKGNGSNWGSVQGSSGTRLITPVDTTTIINHNSNTTFAGSQAPNGTMSAAGSIFFGISFEQETKGTSTTAYGFWMRGTAQLYQCSTRNTASHAIYMNCTAGGAGLLQGDANNWVVNNCFVHTCGGNALHIEGNDVNAGTSDHLVTAGNTIDGCGIFDASGLGNTHINPQMTGYGNGGVFHLGSIYQLISRNPGDTIGGATTPGTNSNVWYPLRTEAAASATFPQWVSLNPYILKLPLYITAYSTVVGGYQEFGSCLAHCPGAAMLGGRFAYTNTSNTLTVRGSTAGLTAINGIGAYRGGPSTNPEYADQGAYSLTMLGTKDQYGTAISRPNILEHQTEQDGTLSLLWRWSNKDMYLNYLTRKIIWSISGLATARTYGRSTVQPHYFTLHDYGLADPGGTILKIYALRNLAVEDNINHARGEKVYNSEPQANVPITERTCIVAGTPGTWQQSGHVVYKGTTANRPASLTTKDIGVMYMDTTLAANGKPIWYTGAGWVDALGATV